MEQDLRKLAADVVGRAAFEERFGSPRLSALDAVLQQKTASADAELLAAVNGSLAVYESLGGKYRA